jgi:hypothetical protein
MNDKAFFIDEYFKRWESDLNKAEELLANNRYYLEGILVLSCYLGSFAAMRYGALRDGEAYVKVVLEYSDKRTFFEQIDLLFFYQWSRSKFKENGSYTDLKQYSEIVDALKSVYGCEDTIKDKTRYILPEEFVGHVKSATIPGFDERNLRQKLHLFSLAELLYRYLRCDAVHNADFPFINETVDIKGNVTYEHNHAITGQVLLESTRSVWETIWKECQAKNKWPYEL